MRKLIPFFKDNYLVCWMLAFILLFYSLLFLSNAAAKKHPPTGEVKKVERVTTQDLKKRELVFKEKLEGRPKLMGAIALSFLLILAASITLNLLLLVKRMRGDVLIDSSVPQEDVPWGIREVVLVFVFLFFSEAVVLSFEIFAVGIFNLKNINHDFLLMMNSLLRDIFVAGLVVYLVVRHFKRLLSQIGLTTKNFFRNMTTGAVGYLAIIPTLLVILFTMALITQAFKYEPPPQPVVEMYLKKSTEKYLVFFTLFVAIAGPVIEEIFFRGFTYKAFRSRYGVRWAIIGSSLIFATLHLSVVAFVPIFFLGVFLGYLYEKTGSLVPCMTVHMFHNVAMVFLTLGFKALSG